MTYNPMQDYILIPNATAKGCLECPEGGVFDASYPTSKNRRGRVQGGGFVSPALTGAGNENFRYIEKIMKKENLNADWVEIRKEALAMKTEEEFADFVAKEERSGEMKKDLIESWARYQNKPKGKGWCFDYRIAKWFRVRKLTPRECFRLMDVDEEQIDKLMANDAEEKQVISNSQLYKMAGNSIVVAPMHLTFENLFYPESVTLAEGEQYTLFD